MRDDDNDVAENMKRKLQQEMDDFLRTDLDEAPPHRDRRAPVSRSEPRPKRKSSKHTDVQLDTVRKFIKLVKIGRRRRDEDMNYFCQDHLHEIMDYKLRGPFAQLRDWAVADFWLAEDKRKRISKLEHYRDENPF
jgi:hypothetical protein